MEPPGPRWDFVTAARCAFPGQNHLAAYHLCGGHPALFLPLHQPGVLHLSCLLPPAVAHRRRTGERRRRGREQVAQRGPGDPRPNRCGCRGRAGIRPVVLASAAVRQRHWRPSRASGRGRIYALDGSLIRSHRAILCRVAPACRAGCRRSSAGPDDRLDAAPAAPPFRGHGERSLYFRCFSDRGTYRPGAL